MFTPIGMRINILTSIPIKTKNTAMSTPTCTIMNMNTSTVMNILTREHQMCTITSIKANTVLISMNTLDTRQKSIDTKIKRAKRNRLLAVFRVISRLEIF
jgi:uncharacterized protein YqgV (UPF0045/DUF77 family)